MGVLNFDGPQTPRTKKRIPIYLGVGFTIALISIGATLAANLNLNGGTTIEFGQG